MLIHFNVKRYKWLVTTILDSTVIKHPSSCHFCFLANRRTNPPYLDIRALGKVNIHLLAEKPEVGRKSLEWQMLAWATNDAWWRQHFEDKLSHTGTLTETTMHKIRQPGKPEIHWCHCDDIAKWQKKESKDFFKSKYCIKSFFWRQGVYEAQIKMK